MCIHKEKTEEKNFQRVQQQQVLPIQRHKCQQHRCCGGLAKKKEKKQYQCCGSGMFIPDHGSEFFPPRIRKK
jgi:hypothetical protein